MLCPSFIIMFLAHWRHEYIIRRIFNTCSFTIKYPQRRTSQTGTRLAQHAARLSQTIRANDLTLKQCLYNIGHAAVIQYTTSIDRCTQPRADCCELASGWRMCTEGSRDAGKRTDCSRIRFFLYSAVLRRRRAMSIPASNGRLDGRRRSSMWTHMAIRMHLIPPSTTAMDEKTP